MIDGINHLTLAVGDVERSFRFYHETLTCKPVARWSRGAYLLAGDLWLCLALDDHVRRGSLSEYTHVALTVDAAAFDTLTARLRRSNTPIWKQNDTEGRSLYFLDPDGHKLEIHVGDLHSRLRSMKRDPWEDGITYFDDGLATG